MIRIDMPRLSYAMEKGILQRWLKGAGSSVKLGEHIADVETEKTHMELLAPADGILSELCVPEGSSVVVGDLLAHLHPSKKPRVIEKVMTPPSNKSSVKLSPLAAKKAKALGLSISEAPGSGPYGRVMACDLVYHKETISANLPAVKKIVYEEKITPALLSMNGYHVYNFDADMSQLAAISIPIAVQSEKLLGSRYCLFDYVVRAAVKGFLSDSKHKGADANLMLVFEKGAKEICIPNANKKNIYNIACERRDVGQGIIKDTPDNYQANLIVCDTGINLEELSARLPYRPDCLIALGGTSPKASMEAGRPVNRIMLPIMLYVNEEISAGDVASRLAGEFKTLMENPVLLLF